MFSKEIPLHEWLALLQKQVQLFSVKEIKFFIEKGLDPVRDLILDLGCGAGFFAKKLKACYPSSKIIAADQSQLLIEAFSQRQMREGTSPIPTYVWKVGHESSPIKGMNKIGAVILRLVLQHSPHPTEFLKSLRKELSSGTKLYIVEEDDDFFKIDPDCPAFLRVIKAWKDYGVGHGNNRFIGASLSRLLSEAGYRLYSIDLISHSQLEVGLRELFSYFEATAQMIHKSNPGILNGREISKIVKEFKEFSDKHMNGCFVFYPEVIAVAEVP